ncbi:MAG: LysM peptidoglycan-binding domain-containing protein [Chloroflexi bacterium]|nr:LysM peptidoglycan-binding domain-containing protein [Chloroflexota bacterium]MCI0578529.1 LysM peptidoglycan-binding domain-containing protein [Chloroflexota bacterium]MCI0649175.1 LysM peptidoglycan-binding domain-containing protein [Chloroflexota bacterium]MCI0725334.1 LysM peptidoglycan-binding domain-containing protein [Chloroflexota bacterium]
MLSRRALLTFLPLLMILALMLAACERPLRGGDENANVPATLETAAEEAGETIGEAVETVEGAVTNAAQPEATEPPATAAATTGAPQATATPTRVASPTPGAAATDEETGGGAPEAQATPTTVPTTIPPTAGTTLVATAAATTGAPQATATPTAAPAAPAAPTAEVSHTVAVGENLYRIGLQYNLSWQAIARYNNLPNPNRIYVGQVLRIPPAEVDEPPQDPGTGTNYTVRRGDTLFHIGQMFGISWVQIAEANGLINPNLIYVGQVLKIPTDAPGPTPQFTHVVQPGDNLYRISLRYGVTWQAIAQANNIRPPFVIYVGQTLVIPGG